jgi:hypothetical protein
MQFQMTFFSSNPRPSAEITAFFVTSLDPFTPRGFRGKHGSNEEVMDIQVDEQISNNLT